MKKYLRIPATYENEVLTVKALGISTAGWPLTEAYNLLAKSCPEHYSALVLGVIEDDGKYIGITIPYNEKVYARIQELEIISFVGEKKKRDKEHLQKATAEEIIKYGY